MDLVQGRMGLFPQLWFVWLQYIIHLRLTVTMHVNQELYPYDSLSLSPLSTLVVISFSIKQPYSSFVF